MAEHKDIRLEFHFKYEERLPAGMFARFIQVAEQAIYETELEDLFEVSSNFPEISKVDLDAVRYRMDHNRGKTLQLEDIYTGSIILSGLAAGLTCWVLDQTLGETLKEAWQDTGFHGAVKEFLLGDPLAKARRIAVKIDEKSRDDLYLKQFQTTIAHEVYESGFEAVLFTIELAPDNQGPPARGEIE